MNDQRTNDPYPERKFHRLPGYDYSSSGAYYFTICTEDRKPHFDIPEIRQAVLETWEGLPKRFPNVKLDEFVIMSNHIHGVLWLDGDVKDAPTLSAILGAFKSITTVAWIRYHKARGKRCSKHLWQRDFFDHITRNDQDLMNTRLYIQNNPLKKAEEDTNNR